MEERYGVVALGTMEALIDYLQQRPYGEVAPFMEAFRQVPTVTRSQLELALNVKEEEHGEDASRSTGRKR